MGKLEATMCWLSCLSVHMCLHNGCICVHVCACMCMCVCTPYSLHVLCGWCGRDCHTVAVKGGKGGDQVLFLHQYPRPHQTSQLTTAQPPQSQELRGEGLLSGIGPGKGINKLDAFSAVASASPQTFPQACGLVVSVCPSW